MLAPSTNMGAKFMSWILLLHMLVIMCPYGSRARELEGTENKLLNVADGHTHLESISDDHQTTDKEHTHHMNHIDDPSLRVFFTMKDLKVGKIMPIYFPKRDFPQMWPREQADSVPFSLNQLPHLLKFFSLTQDSPQAKAMEDTLKECESKPIKGEVKFCATSLESMIDFTQSILGLTTNYLQVYATSHQTKSSVTFQNYTILKDIVEIPAPKMVSCHTMPYPYSVFYCHSQESENRVYKVSLAGENGDKVKAMVVCHLDTSHWGSSHVSFKVLGVAPGSTPVCHFFPADNLIWVPKIQVHYGFSAM